MSGSQHLDAIVVGAGLSGVAAAHHLRRACPDHTFLILESRSSVGGTWDLFRYPGARSDSDMFTLGYPWRPWEGERSISDADSILNYIRDTAAEVGAMDLIRFGQRVTSARWDSEEALWTVEVEVATPGAHGVDGGDFKIARYICSFLYLCCGYFDYHRGYVPAFPGEDRFRGVVVHPQSWPPSLDVAGQRVVVIGSGATAVTLVPALARSGSAHVTMLQRSPGYMVSLGSKDPFAEWLRQHLPARAANGIARWKNIAVTQSFYQLCRRAPKMTARLLIEGVRRQLPAGYPVERDFSPRYDPWDEGGIQLESGRQLPADVVVSATGLELLAFGGIQLSVDGRAVNPGQAFLYRGFMLGGVPNLAVCFGYTNASWTLRADMVSRRVSRLLAFMRKRGLSIAMPPSPGEGVRRLPLLDLRSGYVSRAAARMPKRTPRGPWKLRQNYFLDLAAAHLTRVSSGLTLSDGTDRPTPGQTSTSESSVPNSLAT
jgi:monooxygenase